MTERAFYRLEPENNATYRRVFSWGNYPYPVESCGGVLINSNTGNPAREVDFVPVDLTGCTARMQVRDKVGGALLFELGTTPAAGEGRITLGGAAGTVTIEIDEALLAAQTWKQGVWDLLIIFPGGDVDRFAEGDLVIIPGVTAIV